MWRTKYKTFATIALVAPATIAAVAYLAPSRPRTEPVASPRDFALSESEAPGSVELELNGGRILRFVPYRASRLGEEERNHDEFPQYRGGVLGFLDDRIVMETREALERPGPLLLKDLNGDGRPELIVNDMGAGNAGSYALYIYDWSLSLGLRPVSPLASRRLARGTLIDSTVLSVSAPGAPVFSAILDRDGDGIFEILNSVECLGERNDCIEERTFPLTGFHSSRER